MVIGCQISEKAWDEMAYLRAYCWHSDDYFEPDIWFWPNFYIVSGCGARGDTRPEMLGFSIDSNVHSDGFWTIPAFQAAQEFWFWPDFYIVFGLGARGDALP